jgi:WS/DGAT/MGAT family acyltransferase
MAKDVTYDDRMGDFDSVIWSIEKDPVLRSTITTVTLLDGTVSRARWLELLERVTRAIPRLRQRVRGNLMSIAPPRWETDPHFDLHFHLWWVRAPGKATLRDVLAIAEPIAMSGFDRARPLWRAVVVEGLPQKRSAVILKIHHALTDGVGGMRLQMELLDLAADAAPRPMPEAPVANVLSQPQRVMDALGYQVNRQLGNVRSAAPRLARGALTVARNPLGAASDLYDTTASLGRALAPATSPRSVLMKERSLSCHFDTLEYPLDAAKAVASAHGCHLNDFFLVGLLRGLHQYHEQQGARCEDLRLSVPLNLRDPDADFEAGNSIMLARIVAPTWVPHPGDHMRTVREMVERARSEPANHLVEQVSGVLGRLPTSFLTAVTGGMVKAVDVTASNVPGLDVPVYLGGKEVLAQYAFGPMVGSALNITLLSYVGRLLLGVNTDPAAIADPALLHACLDDAYRALLSAD